MITFPFKRVLLKISGEALKGSGTEPFSKDNLHMLLIKIKDLLDHDVQVGLVLGAGNIFRGLQGKGLEIDQTTSDYMGMLATIMNAIALQSYCNEFNIPCFVMSAFAIPEICESFCSKRAIHLLDKGNLVIFAGGTGSPFFTTDTAASLRACEIKAEILLKATKVDGIYTKDPKQFKDAKRYDTLTYEELLSQRLNVMDLTCIALCSANAIPILVFDIFSSHTIWEVLQNQHLGTKVS